MRVELAIRFRILSRSLYLSRGNYSACSSSPIIFMSVYSCNSSLRTLSFALSYFYSHSLSLVGVWLSSVCSSYTPSYSLKSTFSALSTNVFCSFSPKVNICIRFVLSWYERRPCCEFKPRLLTFCFAKVEVQDGVESLRCPANVYVRSRCGERREEVLNCATDVWCEFTSLRLANCSANRYRSSSCSSRRILASTTSVHSSNSYALISKVMS